VSAIFLNEQSAGEISYELQDLAFCFSVMEVPDDLCALTSSIAARLSEVEKCKVGVIVPIPEICVIIHIPIQG